MTNGANVPVTVTGSYGQNPYGLVAIGKQHYYQGPGTQAPANSYWVLVVDLTSLNVVVNEVYTGTDGVPPGVQPYVDNAQYLLVVTTLALRTDHVPQGDFYGLLRKAGAGPMLSRAEQINEQIGTGYIGWTSYILAATLNPADDKGFEELSFAHFTVMTFELMPVTIDGKTVYTPIRTAT